MYLFGLYQRLDYLSYRIVRLQYWNSFLEFLYDRNTYIVVEIMGPVEGQTIMRDLQKKGDEFSIRNQH